MQDTVGGALAYEQRRLASIMRSHLEQSETEALDCLLQDTQGLYEITLLKRDPRDFSNDEIKGEFRRARQMIFTKDPPSVRFCHARCCPNQRARPESPEIRAACRRVG